MQVLTGARKMRSKLTEVSRFIPCLRNSESVGVLSSLAGRNVQRRLLSPVYVWGAVCFPAFVIQNLWGVLSSLAGRNVQRRLLHQYMCGVLCFSCLRN